MITIDDLPEEGGIYAKTKLEWTEVDHLYIHYFYKIVNNINGKFYYGIHSILKEDPRSNDLVNDGYWGSGAAIHEAEIKYGLENFTKTIEAIFLTRAEVRLKEAEIVTQELVDDRMCYNMVLGGCESPKWQGGWVLVNYADESLRKEKMFSIPSEEYQNNKDKYITTCTGAMFVNYRDPEKQLPNLFMVSLEEYYKNKELYTSPFLDKNAYKNKHNWEEIKFLSPDDPLVLSGQFIGINNGVKQSQETINKKMGEKNGSYGTVWITNGKENKKIKKEGIIPEGWRKGRMMKSKGTTIYLINKITGEKKEFNKNERSSVPDHWIEGFLLDKDLNVITAARLNILRKTKTSKQIQRELGMSKGSFSKLINYYSKQNLLDKITKETTSKKIYSFVWVENREGKQIKIKREHIDKYLSLGWRKIQHGVGHYEITDETREEILSVFIKTLSIKETSKITKVSKKYIKNEVLLISSSDSLRWFENSSKILKRTYVPDWLLPRVLDYGWFYSAPRRA